MEMKRIPWRSGPNPNHECSPQVMVACIARQAARAGWATVPDPTQQRISVESAYFLPARHDAPLAQSPCACPSGSMGAGNSPVA
jgi:hypothetical protein